MHAKHLSRLSPYNLACIPVMFCGMSGIQHAVVYVDNVGYTASSDVISSVHARLCNMAHLLRFVNFVVLGGTSGKWQRSVSRQFWLLLTWNVKMSILSSSRYAKICKVSTAHLCLSATKVLPSTYAVCGTGALDSDAQCVTIPAYRLSTFHVSEGTWPSGVTIGHAAKWHDVGDM